MSVGGTSNSSTGIPSAGRDFSISHDEVKLCMRKMVEAAFEAPQNVTRLKEAKSRAGSDMVKIMQFVFPLAMKIQQETLQQCGYPNDYEGAIKFTQLVHRYEKDDEELAALASRFKTIFMPPLFSQAQFSPNTQNIQEGGSESSYTSVPSNSGPVPGPRYSTHQT